MICRYCSISIYRMLHVKHDLIFIVLFLFYAFKLQVHLLLTSSRVTVCTETELWQKLSLVALFRKVFCPCFFDDLLQGQTEDSLRQHLMNLLSDKASYEAAAKVQFICLVDSCSFWNLLSANATILSLAVLLFVLVAVVPVFSSWCV